MLGPRFLIGELFAGQEEQEDVLPLFVPCPNRQQAVQLIGVGENRDKFILKPSSNTPEHLEMFEFLGKLMGIAGERPPPELFS